MYCKYNSGIIEVICGCMFAGKTQELIRVLSTLKYTKEKIIIFKPKIDSRYSYDEIASHFGSKLRAIPIKKAEEVFNYKVKDFQIIAFDEVQFFDKGIVKIVSELADDGKRVILAGLDQDFKGEPFGHMPALLALSEFVTKLSAICVICGDSATRTQRLINKKPAKYDDPIILVGATESYEARCRKHHRVPK